MTDSIIQLPPDGTGSRLRTNVQIIGGNPVHEQINRSPFEIPRVDRHLYAVDIVQVTTEALLTLQTVASFVLGAGATSHAVPAGKIWRIQSLSLSVKQNSGTAAVQRARIAIRVNPSGAAGATSPIATLLESGNMGALLQSHVAAIQTFPVGIDIPAGAGVGISHVGSATTGHITVSMNVVEIPSAA